MRIPGWLYVLAFLPLPLQAANLDVVEAVARPSPRARRSGTATACAPAREPA